MQQTISISEYTQISIVTKKISPKGKKKQTKKDLYIFVNPQFRRVFQAWIGLTRVLVLVLFQESGWSIFDFNIYFFYINDYSFSIQQTLGIGECTQTVIVLFQNAFPKGNGTHKKKNKDTFSPVINEGIQCIDRVDNVIVLVCLRRLGGQEINHKIFLKLLCMIHLDHAIYFYRGQF